MKVDTILQGDAWQLAKTLPDQSVNCIVTSPPYFCLRDYGTAQWEGGESGCDHVERDASDISKSNTLGPNGFLPSTNAAFVGRARQYRDVCPKCGARRVDSQFGLEPTPQAYVAKLVALFAELRRVLRDDGTLWLNLGDSYANTGNADNSKVGGFTGARIRAGAKGTMDSRPRQIPDGLKPKDLVGIPWRVAFALQEDGWYLRSDIIWHKPNPMPESVTDRPTKAHEYVFLLSKRATYYYDAEAVREPNSPTGMPYGASNTNRQIDVREAQGEKLGRSSALRPMTHEQHMAYYTNGRNRRSVWTIATAPYAGAHFATFPPALVEPCILAGTSARGGCPVCGAPWVRVVETDRVPRPTSGPSRGGASKSRADLGMCSDTGTLARPTMAINTTTGWRPTCAHDAEPVPCVVLDPFMGSGTVAAVAASLGRHYVGFELNPDYIALAHARLRGVTMPLLAEAL